jgi:hypothetical protein
MTARTTRKTTGADKPKTPAVKKGAATAKATAAPTTDATAAIPKTRKTASKPAPSAAPAATLAAPRKTAAAKPAAAPRSDAAPVAPAAPPARARVDVEPASVRVDATRRHQLICEIAYGLYVARGYIGGRDLSDWLQAEAEVDRMLAKSAPEKVGGTD